MDALKADAGQGNWVSLQGGSGPPVTTADREPREAMAYFFQVARAGQGVPWPWS